MGITSYISGFKNKLFNNKKRRLLTYYKNYKKFSFIEMKCHDERQFEASITKLYHAVEKGLSYSDYKPGFGRKNIDNLIASMEQYSKKYDVTAFFYETALCVLHEYIEKNRNYGHKDEELENRVSLLKGAPNNSGGVIEFTPFKKQEGTFDFGNFIKSRHSLRHFSDIPAKTETIIEALEIAQHTPSACNRQGWKARLITNPSLIKDVLANQNGNRGFAQEISSLIIVTGDLRCSNSSRELYQVFIDGGMYAMNILHAIHDKELASIPLSASLNEKQEKNIRELVNIADYEVFIMFIGVGNYPNHCVTTKSARKEPTVEVL